MQLPDGRIVHAVEVPITDEASKTIAFQLGDGSKFTVTVTVPIVMRATSEYDSLGQPQYQMREVRIDVLVRDVPEALMGKPSKPGTGQAKPAVGGVSEVG